MNKKICICSILIERNDDNRYLNCGRNLIETNLQYTDYDIIIITNNVDYFSDFKNDRLIIIDYEKNYSENIISDNRFNMHLKRYPIQMSSDLGYDIIFYNDIDCYIIGWDSDSFIKKCNDDFDVAFASSVHPQLGGLRREYKHFQDKIDLEFGDLYYEELDMSPNPVETRVIFKNNDKLKLFLKFWDMISERNNNYFTYHDGVYFGTSAVYSGMKMISVTRDDKFSSFCRISHGENTLNYFGHKL